MGFKLKQPEQVSIWLSLLVLELQHIVADICLLKNRAWRRTNPSILTRAGMPPDLKMASRPSLWWERLCRVPEVQRAVSTSLVFCMVLTMADTICGDRMMAWREASFLESWCTITAALLTTTWWKKKKKQAISTLTVSQHWLFLTIYLASNLILIVQ